MKVNVYPIPARQAITQKTKPLEQAEIVFWCTSGKVVIGFADGTMEHIAVSQLQKVPEEKPTSTASVKKVSSKKSI